MSPSFSKLIRSSIEAHQSTPIRRKQVGAMKLRSLIFLLLLIPFLSGCSRVPNTPEAARDAAEAFLQARAAGNTAALHAMLTDRAQRSMNRAVVARHLEAELIQYGSLGTPRERAENWVQVPVSELVIRTDEVEVRWPEVWLSFHYDGARWRAAWPEPLMNISAAAYQNGLYSEVLASGRAIAEIDPYHYRGYLEQHFGHRGLHQPREAERMLIRAFEHALPSQEPDLEDAMARFQLELKQPADAARRASAAIAKAMPYTPHLYSVRWHADTMAVLARAQQQSGNGAAAVETLNRALELDPGNAALAVLRRALATSP